MFSLQDEAGVAAYKTVELDDSLGGGPVQHREVQGHESKKFLSYFPKGIQYLAGGVETGFKHVDRDKFESRLLHVKGRRNVRVSQVSHYQCTHKNILLCHEQYLKLSTVLLFKLYTNVTSYP